MFQQEELMQTICVGPMSYGAQSHLVSEKMRARDIGRNDILTRQPISGKKHNGGLKVGALDVSSLLA